jgi:hypothetical protein
MQDIGRIAFLLCIVHVRYFYHGYRKFCLVKFNFPSLHTLNFPSHRRTLRTWHASYVKFHINLSERILNLQRGVKLNGFVAFVSLLGRCIFSRWVQRAAICLPKKLLFRWCRYTILPRLAGSTAPECIS